MEDLPLEEVDFRFLAKYGELTLEARSGEFPHASPLPTRLAIGPWRRQADVPRHAVINLKLPDDNFAEAVRIAQA
jgi:hypothetical protein